MCHQTWNLTWVQSPGFPCRELTCKLSPDTCITCPPPHTNKCNLKYLRAGKIASQIKVFATKFEDLSSIPTTHMVERKNWLIQVILSPPLTSTCSHRHILGKTDNMYMHGHSYNWQNTHTYMQTHTEKEVFKNEI